MKRILICGFFAAVALGIVVLPLATAAPAVKGTGVAFHLAPDIGSAPPVKHDGLVVGAKGTIHRTDSGITINIHTVGLTPGNAYTVWVVEVNCGAPPAVRFGSPATSWATRARATSAASWGSTRTPRSRCRIRLTVTSTASSRTMA